MSIIRYRFPELSTWTPSRRQPSLRDELSRLFDLSLPGFTGDANPFSGWAPALDVYQDKDNVLVRAELPGLKKEEIELSLHEGVLTLSGERKREEESQKGTSTRSERFFGKFERSVELPGTVDSTKVTAAYKDGILTVTLPKAEEAKPKQIQINVS